MTAHPARGRGRPPAADRAHVTAAALRLLDEAGLDALTMRKLATAVGVQVGTLYGYFPTKRALLNAMAEELLAGCAETDETVPSERVRTLLRNLRTALLSRRDGARVYAGTHSTGPNTLGLTETLLGALREGGLEAVEATESAILLVNFAIGHVLEEQATTEANPDLPGEMAELKDAIQRGDYPLLTEFRVHLGETDYGRLFEQGIRSLTATLR
ncbi:TetR/AcrR family transcriptional regulator C-terminal domain-containing protein [Amycolatopsis jejuensis]|uniref:TetR/AcrR family transcriptional regulator C-terminal domain-containing protein n=1 Tax=Amycolatopsis jejuensis TaxID=330084 RepID=UPI0005269702|nr:TetR/AcrR family transcriptional regulator C-terminal domain-containing protein [Amycolatopsis jejuensis]